MTAPRPEKCPYFLRRTQTWIECKGLYPGTIARMMFERKKDTPIQHGVFCCARFTYCEMYQAHTMTKKRQEEGYHVDPLEEAD